MNFLSKHIDGLILMDWQTLVTLAVICAVAAYFIKDYMANPLFVIFVYPFLLLFSVLMQYFFNQLEFFSPKKLDQWLMWTIIASICGTIIGTSVVACVAVLRDRASNRKA